MTLLFEVETQFKSWDLRRNKQSISMSRHALTRIVMQSLPCWWWMPTPHLSVTKYLSLVYISGESAWDEDYKLSMNMLSIHCTPNKMRDVVTRSRPDPMQINNSDIIAMSMRNARHRWHFGCLRSAKGNATARSNNYIKWNIRPTQLSCRNVVTYLDNAESQDEAWEGGWQWCREN